MVKKRVMVLKWGLKFLVRWCRLVSGCFGQLVCMDRQQSQKNRVEVLKKNIENQFIVVENLWFSVGSVKVVRMVSEGRVSSRVCLDLFMLMQVISGISRVMVGIVMWWCRLWWCQCQSVYSVSGLVGQQNYVSRLSSELSCRFDCMCQVQFWKVQVVSIVSVSEFSSQMCWVWVFVQLEWWLSSMLSRLRVQVIVGVLLVVSIGSVSIMVMCDGLCWKGVVVRLQRQIDMVSSCSSLGVVLWFSCSRFSDVISVSSVLLVSVCVQLIIWVLFLKVKVMGWVVLVWVRWKQVYQMVISILIRMRVQGNCVVMGVLRKGSILMVSVFSQQGRGLFLVGMLVMVGCYYEV